MKIKCPKCLPLNGIEIPNFSNKEKNEIIRLLEKSPMNAIVYLKSEFSINLTESKFIILHINKTHNKCNRCNFKNLESEYVNCPKCGSLNMNWKNEI